MINSIFTREILKEGSIREKRREEIRKEYFDIELILRTEGSKTRRMIRVRSQEESNHKKEI